MSDSPKDVMPALEKESVPEYPVIVVRKKKSVTFCYHDPSNHAKCYRFHPRTGIKNALECTKCKTLYNRNRKGSKYNVPRPHSRKFDGDFMVEDPTQGHVLGCEPDSLLDVMQKYTLDDGAINYGRSTGEFLLQRLRNAQYFILYVLPHTDSSQCYRFQKAQTATTYFWVTCSICVSIRAREKKYSSNELRSTSLRLCTVDGFEADPTLDHHPECVPLLYCDVMKNYELVDEDTARKVLLFDAPDMVDCSPLLKRRRLQESATTMPCLLPMPSTSRICYSTVVKTEIEEGPEIRHFDSNIEDDVGYSTVTERVRLPMPVTSEICYSARVKVEDEDFLEDENPIYTVDPTALTAGSSHEPEEDSRDDNVVYFC